MHPSRLYQVEVLKLEGCSPLREATQLCVRVLPEVVTERTLRSVDYVAGRTRTVVPRRNVYRWKERITVETHHLPQRITVEVCSVYEVEDIERFKVLASGSTHAADARLDSGAYAVALTDLAPDCDLAREGMPMELHVALHGALVAAPPARAGARADVGNTLTEEELEQYRARQDEAAKHRARKEESCARLEELHARTVYALEAFQESRLGTLDAPRPPRPMEPPPLPPLLAPLPAATAKADLGQDHGSGLDGKDWGWSRGSGSGWAEDPTDARLDEPARLANGPDGGEDALDGNGPATSEEAAAADEEELGALEKYIEGRARDDYDELSINEDLDMRRDFYAVLCNEEAAHGAWDHWDEDPKLQRRLGLAVGMGTIEEKLGRALSLLFTLSRILVAIMAPLSGIALGMMYLSWTADDREAVFLTRLSMVNFSATGSVAIPPLYAWLQVCMVFFILLGVYCIRIFGLVTNEKVDRVTVTTPDFAIEVDGLPKDPRRVVTAGQLASHFARWGDVVHVAVTFDIADFVRVLDKREAIKKALHRAQLGCLIKARQLSTRPCVVRNLLRRKPRKSKAMDAVVRDAANGKIWRELRALKRGRRALYDRLKQTEARLQKLDRGDAQRFCSTGKAFVIFDSAEERDACLRDLHRAVPKRSLRGAHTSVAGFNMTRCGACDHTLARERSAPAAEACGDDPERGASPPRAAADSDDEEGTTLLTRESSRDEHAASAPASARDALPPGAARDAELPRARSAFIGAVNPARCWCCHVAVREPPEAEDVSYEDLQYPLGKKRQKSAVLWGATVLLLVLSFAFNWAIHQAKYDITNECTFVPGILCYDTVANVLTGVASASIVAINYAIVLIMKFFAAFEYWDTKSEALGLSISRIAIAQFLNTGLMILVIYYDPNRWRDANHLLIQVTVTQASTIFLPLSDIASMLSMAKWANRLLALRPPVVTEHSMRQYAGPVAFGFEDRLSHIIKTAGVSMFYGALIPQVMPLGFLALISAYGANKYALLRLCDVSELHKLDGAAAIESMSSLDLIALLSVIAVLGFNCAVENMEDIESSHDVSRAVLRTLRAGPSICILALLLLYAALRTKPALGRIVGHFTASLPKDAASEHHFVKERRARGWNHYAAPTPSCMLPAQRLPHGKMYNQVLDATLIIDADGSGVMDKDELRAAFRKLSIDLTAEQATAMHAALDYDGSGTLTANELFAAAEKLGHAGADGNINFIEFAHELHRVLTSSDGPGRLSRLLSDVLAEIAEEEAQSRRRAPAAAAATRGRAGAEAAVSEVEAVGGGGGGGAARATPQGTRRSADGRREELDRVYELMREQWGDVRETQDDAGEPKDDGAGVPPCALPDSLKAKIAAVVDEGVRREQVQRRIEAARHKRTAAIAAGRRRDRASEGTDAAHFFGCCSGAALAPSSPTPTQASEATAAAPSPRRAERSPSPGKPAAQAAGRRKRRGTPVVPLVSEDILAVAAADASPRRPMPLASPSEPPDSDAEAVRVPGVGHEAAAGSLEGSPGPGIRSKVRHRLKEKERRRLKEEEERRRLVQEERHQLVREERRLARAGAGREMEGGAAPAPAATAAGAAMRAVPAIARSYSVAVPRGATRRKKLAYRAPAKGAYAAVSTLPDIVHVATAQPMLAAAEGDQLQLRLAFGPLPRTHAVVRAHVVISCEETGLREALEFMVSTSTGVAADG